MSKSASKIRDVRFSVQKEAAKCRRSLSVDCRARGSYVPDKKRPSSDERRSGANKLAVRWGGARKSSINLSEAKRKDTRPLTDKAYQKRKTNELVQFLEETKFTPPITANKLMTPSKKDFENIFQHFYGFFDPTYQVKKIEEEAPKILKNMGYPFTINKSAFVYVARTNWPSLLGVLIWFMDLIKFARNVNMENLFKTYEDDDRGELHSILLTYIWTRYHSGVDDEDEEIAAFEDIIKDKLAPNVDELIMKKEEKQAELAAIEEKINYLKQLADQNVQLDKNIATYEDFISRMQTHYQKKKELCDQLEAELKEKESECKALEEQVAKMDEAYDAQGFDGKKQLFYFEDQKKELAEKLDSKRAIFKEVQDKFHDAQIEYRKCASEVIDSSESLGKEYSDLIESLKSVLDPLSVVKTPQIQKVCCNFQLELPTWEVYFNHNSVESIRNFKSSLENVLEKLKRDGEILKRVLAMMNPKLNEIEVKKSEVSMRLQFLSIQDSKHEQELNSMKKDGDEELSSMQALLKKSNDSIKSFHDEKSASEKIYREMVEEQNKLVEFRENKEKELKEYLIHQREIFECFEKTEKEALLLSESYGIEIAEKLQELEEL